MLISIHHTKLKITSW